MNKYEWSTVLAIAVLMIAMLFAPAEAAELDEDNTFDLTLSYMPMSYHWDRSKDYNEMQHGIGIGMGIGEGYTAGIMRYRNSFGDMSTLFSLQKEIGCWKSLCFGAGAGYATGYKDHLNIPMAAWGSVRWKMIQVSLIPGVTTVSFLLPLN